MLQFWCVSSHPQAMRRSRRQATKGVVVCQDFDTIWHSLLTMVGVMLGGPDLKIYYGSHNAGVCIALLLVYVFAMSLVLLNCLIGIMANACTRVSCPST